MKFIWYQYISRNMTGSYKFSKLEKCVTFPTVTSIKKYISVYKGLLILEVENG